MNKKELIKINNLLTSTFVRVGGGVKNLIKSNLSIDNNKYKDYEVTSSNTSLS